MLDGTDEWLPRSSSLSSIYSHTESIYEAPRQQETRRLVIREMTEEEDEEDVPMGDAGAARLRDMPIRKAQPRRAAAAGASTKTGAKRGQRAEGPSSTSNVIRSRRRLRDPTPDVDVEND